MNTTEYMRIQLKADSLAECRVMNGAEILRLSVCGECVGLQLFGIARVGMANKFWTWSRIGSTYIASL